MKLFTEVYYLTQQMNKGLYLFATLCYIIFCLLYFLTVKTNLFNGQKGAEVNSFSIKMVMGSIIMKLALYNSVLLEPSDYVKLNGFLLLLGLLLMKERGKLPIWEKEGENEEDDDEY